MTRGMTARPRGVVQTRRVSQLCRLERVAGCGEKLAGGTGDVGIGSNRVDFAMSALASAVHNTGHYHVRLGPFCLAPSYARIAYDRRNRGSSGVLSSTG